MYTNFSKIFYRIDHAVPLRNLTSFGINLAATIFFRLLLAERNQFVLLDTQHSMVYHNGPILDHYYFSNLLLVMSLIVLDILLLTISRFIAP